MKLRLAVEDALSETVLRKLIHESGREFHVEFCYPERTRQGILPAQSGWGTLYARRHEFSAISGVVPIIMLVDLDDRVCAPLMVKNWHQPQVLSPNLLLRIAVKEVEAWLLADFAELMEFLHVPVQGFHLSVESIADPKAEIIRYAQTSRQSDIRRDMTPIGAARTGRGYTRLMQAFVRDFWNPKRAAAASDSLRRAWIALRKFRPVL